MNASLTFEYPAIYTLEPDYFLIEFPDLPIDPITLPAEQMQESMNIAAQIMANYISEALMFNTCLPKSTSLEDLILKKNQKGIMIQITEKTH
ncbi:MAG: hypothetical protein PHI94_05275 [Eubacteriaceae bacterium]|nr:hypothetical protein [Eubacteriaceae bacterium]